MGNYVRLAGTSSYLPGEPVQFDKINDYLGKLDNAPTKIKKWMDRIQPLMSEMLGVKYSHFAYNNETKEFDDDNVSMAVKAARRAIEDANLQCDDIDMIIYGGNYSEQMPPISTRVQEELGIDLCGELHIHSNCTSVYKAIKVAQSFIQSGEYKNVLVVSSVVSSALFVPDFYNQEKVGKEDVFLRWFLCDGAGAFVFTREDSNKKEGFYLQDTYIESAGGNKKSAMGNGLPNMATNPAKIYENASHHMRQIYVNQMEEAAVEENGKMIFHNALERMIQKKGIDLSSLKYFVVNMPSKAIRSQVIDECTALGIPREKAYSAVEEMGYPGPPTAIMSIDQLLRKNKGNFEDGDLVVSFVMEVSKFLNAGFTLKYVGEKVN